MDRIAEILASGMSEMEISCLRDVDLEYDDTSIEIRRNLSDLRLIYYPTYGQFAHLTPLGHAVLRRAWQPVATRKPDVMRVH